MSYLVSVYSLSPECRFMAEKVPMHPRNRLSRPIFHVTNSGLFREEKERHDHRSNTDGVKFRQQCSSVSGNGGQITQITVSEQGHST